MYIPINEDVFNQLKKNVIATSKMGSSIHGTKNEHSDDDLLYLYYDKNYSNGIIRDTNGWQYKDTENKIDHNFQEIRTFIQNVISSESHTDHEALVFGFEADKRLLRWILQHINIITYRTVKSYLGRVKKDFKAISNIVSNDKYDVNALYKKHYHVLYGLSYMNNILSDIDMPSIDRLSDVKNNGLSTSEYTELCELKVVLEHELSHQFENGNLQQRPAARWFSELDNAITTLLNEYKSDNFTDIQFGDLLYDVMEQTPTGFHAKK